MISDGVDVGMVADDVFEDPLEARQTVPIEENGGGVETVHRVVAVRASDGVENARQTTDQPPTQRPRRGDAQEGVGAHDAHADGVHDGSFVARHRSTRPSGESGEHAPAHASVLAERVVTALCAPLVVTTDDAQCLQEGRRDVVVDVHALEERRGVFAFARSDPHLTTGMQKVVHVVHHAIQADLALVADRQR